MVKISNVRTGHDSGDRGPQITEQPIRAPSIPDQMMEDPNRIERERDTKGRMIGVKTIEWLDSFDVSCLVGPEIADNNRAFGFALATCSVVEIDGEPVSRPTTKAQLRALMARLGNAGMNAASKALDRMGGSKVEEDGVGAQATKN